MQRESLIAGLKALNIVPSEDVLYAFEVYLNELLRWNKAYNLTAITNEQDIINKHFLDSLLIVNLLPREPLKLCDIGSGAGFPGVPVAIVRPDIKVVLLEPSRKRAQFLYHIRHKLGLSSVEVIQRRVEDLDGISFDVITTRALFAPKELYEKSRRLLSPKGTFVLSLGQRAFNEFIKAKDLCCRYNVTETYIPNTEIKRLLVVFEPNSRV